MMLSWISLVPPSIELPLERSQSARRLAAFAALAVPLERVGPARGHHQLVAALVEFGPGIFHHRRARRMRLARLPHRREPLAHRRERQRVDVEPGDLRAKHRVGRLDRRAQRPAAAKAHAADHLALVAEQIFGDVPALVDLADDLLLGHLHVVEEGLAEGRIAADQQDRLGRHARRLHVEQQEADPALLGLGRGAHQAEDPVGLVGIAGPHLLPVDQPVVAPLVSFFGLGLQPGEVGAGAGLGIALAPADLAARDLRQIMALLLLAAELEQRRPEHRDPEADERRPRADPRHLLLEHARFLRAEPAAAIILRPVGHGPPALRRRLQPLPLRVRLEGPVAPAPAIIVLRPDRLAHLRRAIRLQPGAGFGAEGVRGRSSSRPIRRAGAVVEPDSLVSKSIEA